MRKLLLLLGIFGSLSNLYAQNRLLQKIRGDGGLSKQFTKLEDAEQVSFNPGSARSAFGLNANSGLVLMKAETDKLGQTHYRYYQTYRNIPVENSMYLAHTNSGKLTSMSGSIITQFDSKTDQKAVASLSSSQALTAALNYVHAAKYAWQDADFEQRIKLRYGKSATYYPVPSKVWYGGDDQINPASLTLAYKIDIYTLQPLDRKFIYVDAKTGKILGTKQEMMHADATGTATTGYSGTQTIHSDLNGTSYRLRDLTKGKGIITLHAASGHADYTSPTADWTLAGADKWALDAHFGVAATWTFYKNNFNRNSVDNAGFALTSWVNDATTPDNAFWDGSEMDYGNLSSNGNGVVAIDVTGHELTHGVTQFSSNLVYSKEPGAMNESMSDIMGKSVQFYTKPSDNSWILSNDMNWEIRSFANPNADGQPDTYKGTFWHSTTSASDNYGVHTNSGVGNFMFYLLVNGGSGTNDIGSVYTVNGIGLPEADQILYRSGTVYLTSTSQYANWRTACINAATDLYGAGSNEVIQVQNAWYAVGIGTAGGSTCSAPAGLAVSAITNTTATFSWNSVTGAGYNVQYRVIGTTPWTAGTSVTTSFNATGLTPGTNYECQVQTKCTGGSTSAFSASVNFATTGTPPCNPPTGLTATSVTTTSAILGWTAVAGATGYTLQYKLSSAGTFTTVSGIITNSYNLTGLTVNSSYQFQVSTVCSGTSSSVYSAPFTFATSSGTVTYCASKGNSTTYEYINKVLLGTISNTSGNNNGYKDYTSLSTNLAAGSTNTITLTPGFTGSSYAEFWTVYIDYNHDGILNGSGETVATGNGRAAKALSFQVPATAKNGPTRMRIQMHYGSSITNPCSAFNYGEVEDYTVNITGGTGLAAPGFAAIKSVDNAKGMSVFPNPIGGSTTTISYSLPKDGHVSLKVVDLLGRNIQSVNLGKQTQGSHTYLMNRDKEVSNGSYFIVLYQGNEVIGRNKVIILKR